ncbi:hypothetical protein CU097_000457, partial [Rhizopus azygosporus]
TRHGDNRVVTPPLISSSTPETSSSYVCVDELLVDGIDIPELFYQVQQNAYQPACHQSFLLHNNNRLHHHWIPISWKCLNCTCSESSTKSLVDIINIVGKMYRKNIDRLTYDRHSRPRADDVRVAVNSTSPNGAQLMNLDFTFTEPTDKSPIHAPTFNGHPDCIIMSFIYETDNSVNIGYGRK